MKRFIYADNAATTRLDPDVLEAMLPWLRDDYANASQPYSYSRNAKKALASARACVAACINARPEEIYFTSGGTESDNWAIKGIAFSGNARRGIVTSQIEHHAILNACRAVERTGNTVRYAPADKYGRILPDVIEPLIDGDTGLVSVMLVNNEIGTVQPVGELAQLAHKYGAYFHTDAVQAAGHMEIDVEALGIDMLSASAHKFNGPKGIGFMYIRRGTQIVPHNDGGAQERGMRAGTENIASIVGMAEALKKNCESITENSEKLHELEKIVTGNLDNAGIDYIRNGDPDNRIPGNLSLSFRAMEGEAILHRMDLMGICISTGSACDSVNTQLSHVLRAIGPDEEYARGTVRISLGRDNTREDAEDIAGALIKIARG